MITGEEMKKILEAWRQAFWYFREDVGIGDSFEIENRRLEKNLLKLQGDLDLVSLNPETPGKIRCFLKKYAVLTPEIEDILTRIENDIGVRYSKSKDFDYSEYLEY